VTVEKRRTYEELEADLRENQLRLEEAEETLRAIRNNEVDALVIEGPEGQQIFTLQGAEQPYRVLMETMSEGALTVTVDGIILYCNSHFSELIGMPLNKIMGESFYDFVISPNGQLLKGMLNACGNEACRGEFFLKTIRRGEVPVSLSASLLTMSGLETFCIVAADLTDQKRIQEALEKARDDLEATVAERTAELREEITERKQTEAALRASEVLLNAVMENAADPVYVKDRQSRILMCNPALEKLVGKPAVEIIGKTDSEYYGDPAIGEVLRENDVRVMESGRSQTMEETVMTPDGCRVFLSSRAPYRNESGDIIGIIGISHDITDRKRAEDALMVSEERFRSLYENSLDGVMLTSIDGSILAANKEMSRLTGMTEEEIIQAGREGLVVHDRNLEAALEERSKTGHFRGELLYRRKDGSHVPVEISSSIFKDDTGRVLTSTIVRDITTRKEAEEKVLRQTMLLAGINRIFQEAISSESEEELGAVCLSVAEELTGSKIGFIGEISSDGQLYDITISNPGWDLCRNLDEKGHSGSTGGLKMHGLYGHALKTNETLLTNDPVSHPESIGLPEGHPPLTAFLGVPLTESGKVTGLVAVGNREGGYGMEEQQMVEALAPAIVQALLRKRAEEALLKAHDELEIRVQERTTELSQANLALQREGEERRQTEERLRQSQKMEAIGTLAGGIAHDFNNMLGAIIGFTEMAIDDNMPRNHTVEQALKKVMKAAFRARDLVRQILAFSRKSHQEIVPLQLAPLVKETAKLLRATLPTSVAIEVKIKSPSDTVLADPSQMQQVVMNLCTNAGFAMREKGGKLTLSVRDAFGPHSPAPDDLEPGPYILLSVKDTGTGMDPETMNRIFEPFFTTKQKGQGTGMGLAVVYGIVKSLHGDITVESQPGKGTTFNVFIPRAEQPAELDEASLDEIPHGTERILFVDDEEFLVELGRTTLRHLGYKVIGVTDSQDALSLFLDNPGRFDVVITDQAMPAMTGLTLAKELAKARPKIPIILCTGYSDAVSPESIKEAGVRELVMKPLTKRDLAEAIRRALDADTGKSRK
jgi:PAS domain S-box-containing protein